MRYKLFAESAFLVILGLSTAGKAIPKKPDISTVDTGQGPAVLWRRPTDIRARDLYYGPGGKAHQPQSSFTFTFLKEDTNGTNPKFDVVDQDGIKWRVKLGNEARPEVVASRFVWAVGYFANEYYFLPEIKVQQMQPLRRGNNRVHSGGTMRTVRLKRMTGLKIAYWSWKDNPFKETRPWYGLQVLMALINGWDLKDENNSVYQVTTPSPEMRYVVSDLGATFGATHWTWYDKGHVKSYAGSRWIKSINKDKGEIDFTVPGSPTFPFALNPVAAPVHFRMLWLGRNIPIADARWMGQLLGQLSPKQIRDAFRAGGYPPEDVESFSVEVEKRIEVLKNL